MGAMIEARGLGRTFRTGRGRGRREVTAVHGVDLEVAAGEVVGFLGPNGAGKTTTLRMLTTLLRPTSGTATVAGYDVATRPVDVRRRIGYCSQVGSTFSGAFAGDELVDRGMLHGMARRDAVARGRELFDTLQLEGLWRRMPRHMSGGQRRRLDIAMALVHAPSLVFLDEPTTGLDPQARINLWQHIADLRDRGATVFLTTHYLDEADALADRIVIIDRGRIVASDTPDDLKASVAGDLVDLEVGGDEQVAVARERLARLAAGAVTVDGRHVRGRVARAGREVPGLLRELEARGVVLDSIEVVRPTLDDVFLTLTGRSLRDAGDDAPRGPDGTGGWADPATSDGVRTGDGATR